MNITTAIKSFLPWTKLVFQTKLNQAEIGLVCPYGIGDTYFVCALATEISRANHNSPIVLIVKQHHRDIPQLFPASIIRTVTFQNRQIVNSAPWSRNLAPGKLFLAHPSVKFSSGEIDLVGYKNFNLLDLYRFTFNLNEKAELSSPTIDRDILKRSRQRMMDYGLPLNRTVILAPDSNSTPNLANIRTNDFWDILAHKLAAQGYTVALLTNREQSFLPQLPRINFPLIEAIPFSEMCGWVIAARSGLCDLLATAKTKLTILYPQQKWYGGTLYAGASLRLMGINQSAAEIVVDQSDHAEEIVQTITADKITAYNR